MDDLKKAPEDFIELVERAKRGKLKIYLGYAAGVGKTFQMLREAHVLKTRGVDIVIGYVEPHNRPETAALVTGLEIIPRRKIEYRGIEIEEMDLEAIISRKPQVVIVDEVAHTNVPGSLNKRRFLDIQMILKEGISVICAFNIQHLESLNHLIEKTVGVAVREVVPDTILKQGDQIVTVDLAVEDLLDRLEAGKIYPQEKIGSALSNFFMVGNLAALRELALREVAESLDRTHRSLAVASGLPASTKKSIRRVMVCLASASPRARILLQRGSRLAGRLNTHWFAVYVETPREAPNRIDSEIQRQLQTTLEMARELGAEIVRLQAKTAVEGLLDFARSHGVGDIIVGRTNQPWWKQILGQSPVHSLIKEAAGFDVHVISYEDEGL